MEVTMKNKCITLLFLNSAVNVTARFYWMWWTKRLISGFICKNRYPRLYVCSFLCVHFGEYQSSWCWYLKSLKMSKIMFFMAHSRVYQPNWCRFIHFKSGFYLFLHMNSSEVPLFSFYHTLLTEIKPVYLHS